MKEVVKIGDVFKVSSGGTPSRKKPEYFTNGTIPWVKTGDLKGRFANQPSEYITEEALKNSSAKIFPSNTVLLAMYGATIGACSILDFEAATNQACAALLPSEKCEPIYLYYYLKSIKSELIRKGVGGAQPNISAGIIKDTKIPLPPLPTQKKIAALLDAADAYRQKTKALIEKYDELTQSLFLDMFGDPVVNEKGWEKRELKEITIKIGSGSTPSGGKKAYKDEGISLIRSLNVHDNYFKFKNLAFIDEEQAHKLKNVIVKDEDVLFNITGASVCRCCIVPDEILPARVNQHVSILRPKSKWINSIFLMYCLISKNTKLNLLGIGGKGGATREAITKSDLESFGIIIPSKSLQNQFAERVQKIEAQKAQAQESLEKAEELFNSLLGRAFKGEVKV